MVSEFLRNKGESLFGKKRACNKRDGRCYSVIAGNDSDEASELVGYLNEFSLQFIEHMRNRYVFMPAKKDERLMVLRLLKNYNPETLTENISSGPDDTSFVENKGKKFALCLRKPEGELHDRHLLEFVVLHELSHLADANYGHGRTFWETFRFFLREAQEIGLHTPENYSKMPKNYCGMKLESNPIFDGVPERFGGVVGKAVEKMLSFVIPEEIRSREEPPTRNYLGVREALF
jgi:hypothetical protein